MVALRRCPDTAACGICRFGQRHRREVRHQAGGQHRVIGNSPVGSPPHRRACGRSSFGVDDPALEPAQARPPPLGALVGFREMRGNPRQGLRAGNRRHRWLIDDLRGRGIGDFERRHGLHQNLAVLACGDPSSRKRPAFLEVDDFEINRVTRVAGPQEVRVDAVRRSARCGVACRQQSLSRDVPTEYMVGGRGKLPPDEEPLIDSVELQGGEHVAERR